MTMYKADRVAAMCPPPPEMLRCARDWKAGKLRAVHPEIARGFNAALVRAGEDPVPFRRSTNPEAPTLVTLIRAEYERATGVVVHPEAA